ncbi:hypothetical protein AB0P15_19755 [Streptomyces sp. NPDC087917]|uniref:hypothetical protein n=1 Tax=Streptomyces sp. NPDC087917 TaxID=3155060 RepID=UPI0034318A1C
MSRAPYEDHGTGENAAVPAAGGLALLALGGWLLTTSRPWQRPGETMTLSLEWGVSGALLLSGLALLARCVKTVHGAEPTSPADRPGNG